MNSAPRIMDLTRATEPGVDEVEYNTTENVKGQIETTSVITNITPPPSDGYRDSSPTDSQESSSESLGNPSPKSILLQENENREFGHLVEGTCYYSPFMSL
jgi:hypothetical protein